MASVVSGQKKKAPGKPEKAPVTNKAKKGCQVNIEQVFDLIPTAVVVLDPEHNVVSVNRAAAELAGRTKGVCAGAKFWDLFDFGGCHEGTCSHRRVSSTGKPS